MDKSEYRMTLGLEVHAELSTNTKAYCGCKQEFGAIPNTNICPVCMGLPGALPRFNKKVLEYAMRVGLSLGGEVTKETKFDRKNYFYPDLSKGYQITQDNLPIIKGGKLKIQIDDNEFKDINIERIHMEEDTAKMFHDNFGRGTLIDYNRAGVPLIEIVSKPDLSSAKEAIEYLENLRKILIYLGVSEAKMEEGGFRADVNVSVSKTEELGNRAEIKNMNSFKSIERAINYEFERQVEAAEKGEKIKQETLRWDDVDGKTFVMRSKENANDYRYFLESDLPKIIVSDKEIEDVLESLPEMLYDKKLRYEADFNLSDKQTLFILSDNYYIELFEKATEISNMPKEVSNYLMTEVAAYVNDEVINPKELKISAETIAELVILHRDGQLNSKTGKKVIAVMLKEGGNPKDIMEKEGLVQITDEGMIKEVVEEVLSENAQSVEDIKNGKDRALGFLVGQAMKKSKGKANPKMVSDMINDRISKM